MSTEELISYIYDLEDRVWPGCGHLGGMRERSKINLVAVALMYHQIEDEGLGFRRAPGIPHEPVEGESRDL